MANPDKPTTLEQLRALPRSRFDAIKKADIVDMILNSPVDGNSAVLDRIDKLSLDMGNKIDSIREDLNTKINAKETALRSEINDLRGVVSNQQRFMEQLDSRSRGQNLVIVGVPETEDVAGAKSDEEKVEKIFETLDADPGVYSFKRLGIAAAAGRTRPFLISLDGNERREKMMNNSAKLNESDDPTLAAIRIKRDSHPAIRKEWKRLFDSEKAEKNKPENRGCKIELDRKKRQLLKDGTVIDSWQPLSFL